MKKEKVWYILWFSSSAEPQEPYPLPCLNLITLITYQFSLLLFVCLACPWLALLLRTLADTHLLHGCWLINTSNMHARLKT